jgi:hypothetical protein
MNDDLQVDPPTQERIMAEAVRRGRRRQRRGRLLGAGAVLAIAAGAAAIGLTLAGGPSTQRVTTVNPAVAPTTTRPGAAPALAPTTTRPAARAGFPPARPPGTTVSQPFSPCRAGQLRLSVTPYGYGMGAGAAEITYVNASATECTLKGYPGISISNPSGTASVAAKPTVPGTYLENQNLGWYAPSPNAVNLPPAARAVSYLGWDGGASLAPAELAKCLSAPWTETITLPVEGGTIVSNGNLGLGVCNNLVAEPIQPATYHPAP